MITYKLNHSKKVAEVSSPTELVNEVIHQKGCLPRSVWEGLEMEACTTTGMLRLCLDGDIVGFLQSESADEAKKVESWFKDSKLIDTRPEHQNRDVKKFGLVERYYIEKADGKKVDQDANYFVLRYDDAGKDQKHVYASRMAMIQYALEVHDHLPELSADIFKMAQEDWGMMKEVDTVAPYAEADPEPEANILEEANKITHGDRREAYGHPLDDFTKVAGAVNAMFASKLKEEFSAEDIPIIVALMKIARQMHLPKRDNMVDLAGYAWVSQECIEERDRREPK